MRLRVLLFLCLLSGAVLAEETPSVVPPPANVPLMGEVVCPQCHGSGRVAAEDTGLRMGGATSTSNIKRFCPLCRARGRVNRKLPISERLERQKQQRATFDRAQLAAGLMPIGGGYAPRDFLAQLSPEAYADLARKTPRACKACAGLAQESCRSCRGTGEKTVSSKQADGKRAQQKEICAKCSGAGALTCRACNGSGVLPLCKKCQGTGVATAKAGKGQPAGTLERCRACKGEGRR